VDSVARQHYDREWRNFRSGPPAADPRSGHHDAFKPDPEFVTLCSDAERLGLFVGIGVSKRRLGETDREFRLLDSITVENRQQAPLTKVRMGPMDTIRRAAAQGRRELEKATS